MSAEKKQRLEAAGWKVGSAAEFLGKQEAVCHCAAAPFAHRHSKISSDESSSAGSSAVPRCPECGRQMSADGEGWFVCAHNHPAIYCERASPPAVSGPLDVLEAVLSSLLEQALDDHVGLSRSPEMADAIAAWIAPRFWKHYALHMNRVAAQRPQEESR